MKSSEKLLSVLMIIALVLGTFASCSKPENPGTEPPTTPDGQVADIPDDPGEIAFSAPAAENVEENNDGLKYVNNEICITAVESASKKDIEDIAKKYNAEIVGCIEITGDYQLRFINESFTKEELNEKVNLLLAEPVIADAYIQNIIELAPELKGSDDKSEDVQVTPNDSRWKKLWGTVPDGKNWGVEAIHADKIWKYLQNCDPIRVGLIDTYFNTSHEDLDFAEVFYNIDPKSISDPNIRNATKYHGSHVAGTMAATSNNGKGIAGVYPFGENNLYGFSMHGADSYSNFTSESGIFTYKCALAELICRNVKVINISLGFDDVSKYLAATNQYDYRADFTAMGNVIGDFLERLLNKGYDFVIACSAGNTQNMTFAQTGPDSNGNHGWVVSGEGNNGLNNLADWGSPFTVITNKRVADRIIVVGAAKLVNPNDPDNRYEIADFSSTGSRVDVMAPGVDIDSCTGPAANTYEHLTWDGTSMASPHVAGAAACIWTYNKGLTGDRVKQLLVDSTNMEYRTVAGTDVGMISLLYAFADAADEQEPEKTQQTGNGTISAVVRDTAPSASNNGSVIDNAVVTVVNEATEDVYSGKTDNVSGSFQLNVPEGTYTVVVKQDGYGDVSISGVEVKAKEVTYLDDIYPLQDFTLPDSKVLTLGEVDVLEPEVYPVQTTNYAIVWTSSDPSVATVSPEGDVGIITALSKGTTTITADVLANGKFISHSTDIRVATTGRDTVLVLDVSGSMSGTPMTEMKKAAINFCNDLLADEYNNRVGLVTYDDYINTYDLTSDLDSITDIINGLSAGSTTNMGDALTAADEMLKVQGTPESIKNVVVMADGIPNEGPESDSGKMPSSYSYYEAAYANAAIDIAESMMSSYNMYSLGFFHSLYGDSLQFANDLMTRLTDTDENYYQVDVAENIQFAFGDIAETISDGSKIVINIACPVDVVITDEYGETLSSVDAMSSADNYIASASFGSVRLLGKNHDIKVVSLDPNKVYDVDLSGTDTGYMDYSVNYYDDNDNLTDYRSFMSVPISVTTKIKSSTDNTSEMSLEIDEDSDGIVDAVWKAARNSTGFLYIAPPVVPSTTAAPATTEPQAERNNTSGDSGLIVVIICVVLLFIVGIIVLLFAVSSKKGTDENVNNQIPPRQINNEEKIEDNNIPIDTSTASLPFTHGITILSGDDTGKQISIPDNSVVIIGKDKNVATARLANSYIHVSRIHCSVEYRTKFNKFYITDMSSNGTYYLNHTRLQKGKRTMIEPGTVLMLSNEECKISLN